jgi:hypothetical protein
MTLKKFLWLIKGIIWAKAQNLSNVLWLENLYPCLYCV